MTTEHAPREPGIRIGEWLIWQLDGQRLVIRNDDGEALTCHVNDFADSVCDFFARGF